MVGMRIAFQYDYSPVLWQACNKELDRSMPCVRSSQNGNRLFGARSGDHIDRDHSKCGEQYGDESKGERVENDDGQTKKARMLNKSLVDGG